MTGESEGMFNPLAAMWRMWSDCASQMMQTAMPFSPSLTSPDALREVRAAAFQAWNDYCQQAMRSPWFLETMRQAVAANIQVRKQINDALGEIQHAIQAASSQDVDQLMLAVRHVEQRTVDGIERLAGQLDDLAERLQQLERMAREPNGDPARFPKSERRGRKTNQEEPQDHE